MAVSAEPVVTELTIDGSGAERGQGQYVRAMDAAKAAMEKAIATNARLIEAQDRQVRATGMVAAANDNLARSYGAANDNVRVASEGFKSQIVEVASMTNHLKFAALAAYAYSPAVRAMVNPAVTASVAALGPAAVSAGAAIFRALSPALAFLSKIALPILAIVIAWKALNALVDQGSELLEKYGNASRRFDSPNMAENLKKLTALQDNSGVSVSQQQYAAQLSARLEQAKFRLQEFMKVQFDLNDVGLFFQKVWINIVETVAKAADGVTKMIGLIGQAWDKLTGLGTQIGIKIGEAIRAYLPENIKAALTATPGDTAASKGDFDVDSRARALKIARANISAQLGTAAGAANENANIGGTFTARWNNAIDALSKKAPEAKKEVAALASEFDRLEKSMQRSAAVQEAEAKAVDASVGEHARLRAEMRLQEAAQQDIAKNGGKMEDYAERIKTLADRFGVAAQKAAELKLASDVKFTFDTMFLSDTDKQIASVLRQVKGKDWKSFMDSPIADAMRLNAVLKQVDDTLGSLASGFLKDRANGVSSAEAMHNAYMKLRDLFIDMAAKKLVSAALSAVIPSAVGETAGASVGATSAGAVWIAAGTTFNTALIAAATTAAGIMSGGAITDAATKVTSSTTSTAIEGAGALSDGATKVGSSEVAASVTLGAALSAAFAQIAAGEVWLGITEIGAAVWAAASQNWIAVILAAIAALVAAIGLMGSGDDGLAKKIKEWQDAMRRAFDYDQRRLQAQSDGSLASQLQLFDRDAAKQRFEELEKGGLALEHLEAALAAERIKIITDFNKEAADRERQHQEAIARAQESAQDRIFAATNDTSTLEGARAEQDRRFARERLDQQKEIGFVTNDLLAAQQAEEFALRKSFNDKIIDETKRAEEARLTALNGAAKSVVDYLAGLQSGPNATVSPLANLSNSQSLYNANLALAQGGNIDAQNKFSSLADNLEKAARAVYASSQGYQDIRSQIIAQGLALPSVQTTTDPLVIAMRDVVAAVNAGNATQALDATLQNVIKSAIDAGNAAAFAAAITPKFDQLNTTADQGLTFAELVAGVNGLSRDTTTAGLLTQAQIDSLGFSRESTVGQLLTRDQLSALGLSRDVTVSALDTGNLLKIFQTLDSDGDGTLSRLELIRSAQDGGNAISNQIWANAGQQNGRLSTITGLTDTQNALINQSKDFLNSMNSFTARVVNAINALGALTASIAVDSSKKLADIAQFTLISAAKAVGQSSVSGGSGGSFSWLGFQGGGYTGDVGSNRVAGVVHGREFVFDAAATSAIGLSALNFANENRRLPTNVVSFPTPSRGFAGGDNSALISALMKRIDQLEDRLVKATLGGSNQVARTIVEKGDDTIEAIDENGKRVSYAASQAAKDNKAA